MVIETRPLHKHLARIDCDGAVTEVVLRNDLGASAITTDRRLLVRAPGLTEHPALPTCIGLSDLGGLLKIVRKIARKDGQIDVRLDRGTNRLVLQTDSLGSISIPVLPANVIGTRVDQKIVDSIQAFLAPFPAVLLEQAAVARILAAQQVLRADTLTLRVGTQSSSVLLGNVPYPCAEIPLETLSGDDDYELRFATHPLIAVLKQLDGCREPSITVTGRDSMVSVQDDGFTYVVSPEDETEQEAR